jgi:hypothetical protein
VGSTAIETRIASIEDRLAIQQLPIRYCHYIRRQDVEAVLSLYAAGSSFQIVGDLGPSGHFGGTRLRELLARGVPVDDLWPLTHNHLIEIESPRRATGLLHVEFRAGASGFRVTHIGVYEDEYIKESGIWKFQTRRITTTPVG